MSASPIPILLPVVPMFGAVLAMLLGLWRPVAAQIVAVLAMATTFVLSAAGLVIVSGGVEPLRHELGGWPPPVGIEYLFDPLAGFIAVIVSGIGLLAVVYPTKAGYYVQGKRGVPLYPLVLLLLAGLLGVLVSADLFHLFVMLEIFAISTYALVSLGGPRAVFASFRYLLIGTAGSGLYLLGVGFLYFTTGSLNMADVAGLLPELVDSPTIAGSAVLITVGLGIKMALFPLHVWLPDAHTSAPPAVAALLAAVQVKIGAYALMRILYGVYGGEYITVTLPIGPALVWFGAAGILAGSVMAVVQSDFKRLLAYSTVAQLGFIGVGIGLGTPLALAAALLHVLAHALMKSCLFFIAGGVYAQTGIRNIADFAGLGRKMPLTMAAFSVAALSMVGIPPTVGFFSKFYLVWSALDAGWWPVAAVIVLSSLLTAAYFLRVIEKIFVREPQHPRFDEACEPELRVLGPIGLLAVIAVVAGFANVALLDSVLTPVAAALLPG